MHLKVMKGWLHILRYLQHVRQNHTHPPELKNSGKAFLWTHGKSSKKLLSFIRNGLHQKMENEVRGKSNAYLFLFCGNALHKHALRVMNLDYH